MNRAGSEQAVGKGFFVFPGRISRLTFPKRPHFPRDNLAKQKKPMGPHFG